MRTTAFPLAEVVSESARIFILRRSRELLGLAVIGVAACLGIALATWSVSDPSLNHATDLPVHNGFGFRGAIVADLVMQLIGVSSIALLAHLRCSGGEYSATAISAANPAGSSIG